MSKSYWWLLGGAAVVLLGLALWWQAQPEPEPAEAPVAEAGGEPATEPSVASSTGSETAGSETAGSEAKPAAEPAVSKAEAPVPVFDVVRVSPDGQTVIAGHAEPGQTVEVLLDGAVVGSSVAGSDGAFATVLDVPPSGESRELTLRVLAAGGGETAVSLAPADQTAAATAATGDKATGPAPATALPNTQTQAQGTAQGTAEQAAATSGGTATVEVSGSAAPATAAVTAATGATAGSETYIVGSPVIILPQQDAEKAPVLVKPEAEDVKLLQPAEIEPGAGIALDRITYSSRGDLIAAGRGEPGTVVRVYVNARFVIQVRGNEGGQWQAEIGSDLAAKAQLLRFDAVDATGKVIRRLETPFEYSPSTATHEVRERKIEVQRGDYLWKFAEQYYGQGWRYSVIFSANSGLIRDPDLIYPGQVFTIPELVQSQ